MEDRCEICGEDLDGPAHDHGRLLGEAIGHVDASVPVERRGRDRRWLLAVAGIIVGWLAVVTLGRLAAPSEVVAPPPTPRPASTATPTSVPSASSTPTDSTEILAEESAVAEVGAGSGPTVQVERLVRQLGRRGSEAILAYRSREGIVLVDLARGTAELVEPSTDALAFAPQYVVLRTGGDTAGIDLEPTDVLLRSSGYTFAIDPEDLGVRLIADDASLIVSRSRAGAMFWVPGRELQVQAPDIISMYQGSAQWFLGPTAFQLAVKDELGLIALGKGPSGGTLLAGSDGFEPLSEYRVFAGNANGILEEVCPTPDSCDFRVTMADGTVWQVPAGFIDVGDRFVLSPDALGLLRHTPYGFAEIYRADDNNVSWVTGASMRDGAWGPDGTFVAWIDLLGAPELRVMFIDERDWLSINLGELGVPRPLGTEVVVFAQPSEVAQS